MIVDMISSLGRSVIKFFRALGRSGFIYWDGVGLTRLCGLS